MLELVRKALSHNSTLADSEPSWGSVKKTKLPRNAYADKGEAGKKSTWKYPHHHVVGGEVGDDGFYTSGTMYLHKGGLNAAYAAAQGARSGVEASASVKSHIEKHRKAIGADKEELVIVEIGNLHKAENEEDQVVYGEVYVPNRVDTDGETMSEDDVEKAAWEFLASNKVEKIDIQHSLEESGCVVVESFIAREGWDPWVDGAWVMGVKCIDDIWADVKSGELNGFSFYGTSEKVVARVLVEVAKQISGITEENVEDILPPHEHTFVINLDNDGVIVSGKTDVVLEHSHIIKHGTATEEQLDHRHRVILE